MPEEYLAVQQEDIFESIEASDSVADENEPAADGLELSCAEDEGPSESPGE